MVTGTDTGVSPDLAGANASAGSGLRRAVLLGGLALGLWLVLAVLWHDTPASAVEINSRPERLDPPKRLLRLAVELGCSFAIDTDAHAPGQLDWQGNGCERAVECGVPVETVINTWPAERLLDWTTT